MICHIELCLAYPDKKTQSRKEKLTVLNKKIYIFISVIALITLLANNVYASKDPANSDIDVSNSCKWKTVGVKLKEIYGSSIEKQIVVAKINGEDVTKQEIQIKKAYIDILGKELNLDPLIDEITKDKVIISMAKKRGLYPTQDETLEYMKTIYEDYTKFIADGAQIHKESWQKFQDILNGLEMTEDEYWKNENIAKEYRILFAHAKLKNAIAEELGVKIQQLKTKEEIFKNDDKINKVISDSQKQAKVEILDPNFFEQLN